MRLTVVGCSGSVAGPDSPASSYLVTAEGAPPLVIDLGGGALGALQRYVDPASVTVLLSHLHADHCLDVAGLLVWRRYHPSPVPGRTTLYGPTDTAQRLAAASCAGTAEVEDISDVMELTHWRSGEAVRFGSVTVLPQLVEHPCEAFGLRVTDPSGVTLVYTGDTGPCAEVEELAQGADVLLAEASWTDSPSRPVGVHLSGTQAGQLAQKAGVGRLLLTHIPPWTSREDVVAEARAEFDGEVHAVSAGEEHDIVHGARAGSSVPARP
ncbi:MBL fold metallo-hydrolase [Rhodococcus sp. X156]|uniref:MBL fold metallo-hydrolase n=1 Tax=Rhodococcus sp. X156 TaxID=2499145 RepID=UPI0019D0E70A|nr:MBL fold metallo-hydrolase [Rhodococcus sp. X156]